MSTSQLPVSANLSQRLLNPNSSENLLFAQRRSCLFRPFDRFVNALPSDSNGLSNILLGYSLLILTFSLIAPSKATEGSNNRFFVMNPPEERIVIASMGIICMLLGLGLKNALKHRAVQNEVEEAERIRNEISEAFAV